MTTTPIDALRLRGIDWLRGVVMVLMVVDHVRVYAGIPPGGASPELFFTRWITHFCAPVFVFLAGVSAGLYARQHEDLSRFLFRRGLWLIVLEFTLIRLFWTFNFDVGGYALAGVIWVIGISLVLMAAITRLPERLVLAFGVLLVFGHNLIDPWLGNWTARTADSALAPLWTVLYLGPAAGPIRIGSLDLHVLYSIVPWLGVMALGYTGARLFALPAPQRDRMCVLLGLAAIVLFVLLRASAVYGDPRAFQSMTHMPAALAFLNAAKYPASLQFLLMTLGPALLVVPFAERARGFVADALVLFGREPLLFYLLHIPLVHALAILVSWMRVGAVDPWLFANHPMDPGQAPEAHVWPLWLLYAVVALALPMLYVACARYRRFSAVSPGWRRWL